MYTRERKKEQFLLGIEKTRLNFLNILSVKAMKNSAPSKNVI
jgi:hypothetical protein